jgi:two-component system sensor histidine kinase SenX3
MSPQRRDASNAALEQALSKARSETETVVGQRDRFLAVLDELRQGVVVLDADGIELFRNPAAERYREARHSELKTPIGALEVLAETLVAEDDPSVTRPLADRIVKEAERLARIVDDLLDLSLIETQEAPRRSPIPLEVLVDDSVDQLRPAAAAAGINLRVHPGVTGALVACDRRQVVSAIANLIDNAVKYSEAGSPVTVSTALVGNTVEVAVRDAGIGIPGRDLERIFERFYRVDQARSRATGGTGLGLAIVRHVARAHGGDITVESIEGQGSTFRFVLPLEPESTAVPSAKLEMS